MVAKAVAFLYRRSASRPGGAGGAAWRVAAATNRTGNSSIMLGAIAGSISMPVGGRVAHPQIRVPWSSPSDFANVSSRVISAPIFARSTSSRAGAGRVEADIHDRQIAARNDAGRDHEERSRGRIARHGHIHRFKVSLAVKWR